MSLRPTYMGFEMGKQAIFANQKSLDIVGNNLTNLDTEGYTRQRVDRASVAPANYTSRVASSRTGLLGQGVNTLGVDQIRDPFLDQMYRSEFSDSNYHIQASNILNDIQSALGDGFDITSEAGLFSALENIYSSLNNYILEPTLDTEANLVMSAFRSMTQTLNQLDEQLNNVSEQHSTDLQINVDRTNEILEEIAYYNGLISQDTTVTSNGDNEHYRPNELYDKRNTLLDELAAHGDIVVTEHSNGEVDVAMGGHMVVEGLETTALALTINDDLTVALNWRDTGESVTLQTGGLRATLDFLNGRGLNMQSSNETPEQGVPYYRDRLDTFATALAELANTAIPVFDETTGEPMVDVDGNTVYKTFLAANLGSNQTTTKTIITAENITLSEQWIEEGAGYFIYNRDVDVENYAQQLAYELFEGDITFMSHGESFEGTFSEYELNFLGILASEISYQEGRFEATNSVATDFQTRREAVSGVSSDEETADMIKYQKSYEAAARFMTVLDELLDTIINNMGRVGL